MDTDINSGALQSTLEELAHLLIDSSRLRILDDSEIGFGGFGEVYLAMLDGSLKVAVKQLRIIQTKGIRARVAMRLARELKIWAKAKHPNVLKLVGYHLSENYDCAQLLSPYMQNGNIAEYMKRTEASMEARLGFVRGITLGMAHLHACDPPICHGDLKPANVLINDKPDAVLCDFGLAVFIEDSGASSGLTTSRSIKGSLRYMSPELLDDDEAKHTLESDIWAWACTIFEIITSVSPYTDLRTDRGIRAAVVRGVFPGSMELLEGFAPEVDNPYRSTLVALQALIPECWTTELGERPPSSSILNRLHYVDLGNSDLPPAQAPLDDKQTDDSAMVERVIADLSVLSKLQITGESDHVDTVPGISNRANFGNDRGALQAPSAIPPLPVHMPLGDDPSPVNHSSYTENGSRFILRSNLFDPFPDELIIYTLSFPSLPAVVRFASTSRRHRYIASADQIWFPVALGIIRDNVDPNDILVDERFMRSNCNRILATLGLSLTDTRQAWYRIATRLLEQVEWSLGWWLGKLGGSAKGCLWRIFIEIDDADPEDDEDDDHFFRVIATRVEVVENDAYNLLLQPGGPLASTSVAPGISTVRLFGDPAWSISVDGFRPLSPRLVGRGILTGYLPLNSDDPLDNDSPSYSARKLQDHLPHLPLGMDSWKRIADRRWYASFSDAPYPPPLLSQLLDQRKGRTARDGRAIPSIALVPRAGAETTMETLFSIRRPSSFSKMPNELVHTGIYVAPYLPHGWEYLLVRVRELTEEDFQDTWPWEGSMAVAPSDAIQHTDEPNWESPHSHLGPFSGIIPTRPISSFSLKGSRDHVRQGSRVLEGIKIHGDENVPGGQRSFIAFLDDPLVRPEALEEAEESFVEVSPEREGELPWPFVSRPPTTTESIDQAAYAQTYFSPERGIDIPGVMRVAGTGFSRPQWADCVVHVECKTKFTMAWFGAVGMVFRKLHDWGI